MDRNSLTIRELIGAADYEACVALQRATWGDDFRELVPPAVLLVTQKIGGVLLGAFDRDAALVGFVYGISGLRDGKTVHWSHMLAVHTDWRDHGLGQSLKRHQRDAVRALGVPTMLWTFDPLVARNAHINLNRLGARILEYAPNLYGETPMSPTDSVIGTDRFIVAWDLTRDTAPQDPSLDGPRLALDTSGTLPNQPEVGVAIPTDVQQLKQHQPELAAGWREFTRAALTHYLDCGYGVVGLARHPATGPSYILRRQVDAPT